MQTTLKTENDNRNVDIKEPKYFVIHGPKR